jgi:arylsulfatase A-like enzyme
MKIIGLPYPSTFDNISLKPPAGISLKVALQGNQPQARDFFFEHETSCSLIHNDWKLVRRDGLKSWEPYNIKNDPFEQLDLASKKYRDPNQPKKNMGHLGRIKQRLETRIKALGQQHQTLYWVKPRPVTARNLLFE